MDAAFAFAIAVFLLAGVAKGVLGMGLPTLAVGLLALAMSPAEAAVLLLVPSLVTNAWQALDGRALAPLLRRFWPMLLAIAAGTLCTVGWLAGAPTRAAAVGLGICLAVYGVLGLSGATAGWRVRGGTGSSTAAGFVTGAISGASGVFVLPAVPYLQACGLARDALVQALGLAFTTSTIALGVGLWLHDALPAADLARSSWMLPSALAGMALGRALRRRMDKARFKRVFFAGLVLLGAWPVIEAGWMALH